MLFQKDLADITPKCCSFDLSMESIGRPNSRPHRHSSICGIFQYLYKFCQRTVTSYPKMDVVIKCTVNKKYMLSGNSFRLSFIRTKVIRNQSIRTYLHYAHTCIEYLNCRRVLFSSHYMAFYALGLRYYCTFVRFKTVLNRISNVPP